MKTIIQNKKYIGLIALIFIVNSLPMLTQDYHTKYDVYLFVNQSRRITFILWDLSVLFEFAVLTYLLQQVNYRVFMPLFIVACLGFIFYFTIFNLIGGYLALALYFVVYFIYNRKSPKT